MYGLVTDRDRGTERHRAIAHAALAWRRATKSAKNYVAQNYEVSLLAHVACTTATTT